MYKLFLAIRYLLTRPINLLGMGGIAISAWALVVVVSLFTGFLQVIEQHLHSASADILISGLPSWTDQRRLEAALRDDPNVAHTAPRLLHYGLLLPPGRQPPPAPLPGRGALHGGDQPFLFVIGVDPVAEAATTGFARWLVDPQIPAALRVADPRQPFAATGDRPAVLIGLERMRRDGLTPGDPVVLTTARLRTDDSGGRQPERAQLVLTVAGAFKTEHGGFDGNNVFLDLEALRAGLFPDTPGLVHEIAVRVADEQTLDDTAERLQRIAMRTLERNGRAYGTAETWRQRNALFLGSVEHQGGLLKIVLIVIMVVAAFLMLATLSMMVTEKTADIGILTAMGGTPFGVTEVFLSCGLVITTAGLLSGIALGTATAIYLEEVRQALRWAVGIDLFPLEVYNLERVPSAIDPRWLLKVAGMALGTGIVVSTIPALRAGLHDPLVSLRGE